ncbi:phage tail protein [Pseudomonas frederiksbergensis]|uniref:Phage tail protein n=1 Tax=Pseudomonas frederiksbergensis TaxID=104087 RepID=A0A423KIF1_9PSED|nr:putative phage tail protein [Pseudomonas frederiksbergensis]RON52935.1 phage tail protein [Pseudomonas frederiksbergensis]
MPKPSFTSADFTSALLGLLPRGRVWPKDLSSVHAQAVSCFAPTFQRLSDSALDLLSDAFPSTSVNLLGEWELTLGLPDPCAGVSPTFQGRRNQVVARFTNTGGQSIQYFQAFALGLGYTITVTQYAPFRCGQSTCGQQLGSADWFFTWAINTSFNTITYFRTGQSAMGDPLASWGNSVLECELSEAKPAHTILQFHYS